MMRTLPTGPPAAQVDQIAKTADSALHFTRNSNNLAGYFEEIFKMFVWIPFSRQARKTSRLSKSVLRQPPVLMPPTRIRTSVSGRLR